MTSLSTSHVYLTDAVLPFPGEVIKIHCSVSSFDFNFGPSSDDSLSTRPTTVIQPNTVRTCGKPPFHHVILNALFVSPSGGTIEMQFFPIASYPKPPSGFTGTDWNASTWMEAQSEEIILQHLPVPAIGWSPAPHHIWGPDPLDFGVWLNTKPAWVLVAPRRLSIPVTDTWKRFCPPVVLSPAHLTALRGFEGNRNAYLFSRQNLVAVNHAVLPDYGPVCAGPVGRSDNDNETGSDSGGSDDSYGVDPVTMWRYDGAPKVMRDMVDRHDEAVKKVLNDRISMWVVSVQEPCVQEEAVVEEEPDADMLIDMVS